MLAGDFTQVASAACRAQGNLNLPAPFVNNRIDPALFSPAAVKIAQRLPTTTDPCGRITYSRQTKPRRSADDRQGRLADRARTTPCSAATYGRPPSGTRRSRTPAMSWRTAPVRRPRQRFAFAGDWRHDGAEQHHRQQPPVHHPPHERPPDARRLLRSRGRRREHLQPLPNYILVSVTGGSRSTPGRKPTPGTVPTPTRFSDDLTMVRGNHQWGFGASVAFSDWKTMSNVRSPGPSASTAAPPAFAWPISCSAGVFEFRQATPFRWTSRRKTSVSMRRIRGGCRPRDDELRRPVGAVVPAAAPEQRRSTTSPPSGSGPVSGARCSRRRLPGSTIPATRASRQGGHAPRVAERPAAGRRVVGPERRRPHVGAGGVRHERRFHRRRVLLRRLAGAAVRLGAASDQPAVGFVSTIRGAASAGPTPTRSRRGANLEFPPGALYIQMPKDLKTTRVHSWNLGVQHQIGDNMGVSATYLATAW